MDKDLPSTLGHLIADKGLEVQCRVGSAVEAEMAVKALEETEEIVVDEMTLTTLLFYGVYEHLGCEEFTAQRGLGSLWGREGHC